MKELAIGNSSARLNPVTSIADKLACIHNKGPTQVLDTVLHGMPDELEDLRFILPKQMAFISILPDKLAALKKTFLALKITCVSSDLHKQYTAFCSDFGPVNLSIVHRFTRAMASKLTKLSETGSVLLYCIEPTFESIANASFLLGAFLVLHAGYTPFEAAQPFVGPDAPFTVRPFRDATFTPQVRAPRARTGVGWDG